MPRSAPQSAQSRRALLAAVGVLALTSLLPLRALGWARWFGGLAETLVTPISHPASALSRWLAPAQRPSGDDPRLTQLGDELERYKTKYLREMEEAEHLRALIKELQQGIAINPNLPVRQLVVPVVGVSSDPSGELLRLRAGTRDGVEVNTVATGPGLQLLGRVVDAGPRLSKLQLITSRAAGRIQGRIMLDEADGTGLLCLLDPVGDGRLPGAVQYAQGQEGVLTPIPGQVVRLDDASGWPANAQMLPIGRVERMDSTPDSPLRKVVTVRPAFDLGRVREALLRVTAASEENRP